MRVQSVGCQDGLIYLDLADEFWRCVELGANRWRIARTLLSGSAAAPACSRVHSVRGGSIDDRMAFGFGYPHRSVPDARSQVSCATVGCIMSFASVIRLVER
jgi:hypothetical protein